MPCSCVVAASLQSHRQVQASDMHPDDPDRNEARPSSAAGHWAAHPDRMGPLLYARSQGATTPAEAAPHVAAYRAAHTPRHRKPKT